MKCKNQDCLKDAKKNGLCVSCYQKELRNKRPGDEGYKKCSVADCFYNIYNKKEALCHKHYNQLRLKNTILKTRYDKNEYKIYDDYAEIILCDKDGKENGRTKVSLDMLPALLEFKWSLKDNMYVRARCKKRKKNILMQRFIMDILDKGSIEVRYKNKDTFDNRCDNLILSTHKDNALNSKLSKINTSGIKGVSYVKSIGKWRAYITVDGVQKHLKLHDSINKAEAARKRAEENIK